MKWKFRTEHRFVIVLMLSGWGELELPAKPQHHSQSDECISSICIFQEIRCMMHPWDRTRWLRFSYPHRKLPAVAPQTESCLLQLVSAGTRFWKVVCRGTPKPCHRRTNVCRLETVSETAVHSIGSIQIFSGEINLFNFKFDMSVIFMANYSFSRRQRSHQQ
jgi:hypothetical protein